MKELSAGQDSGVSFIDLSESQVVSGALFTVCDHSRVCAHWHSCHCCQPAAHVSGLIKARLLGLSVNESLAKSLGEKNGSCTHKALIKQFIQMTMALTKLFHLGFKAC